MAHLRQPEWPLCSLSSIFIWVGRSSDWHSLVLWTVRTPACEAHCDVPKPLPRRRGTWEFARWSQVKLKGSFFRRRTFLLSVALLAVRFALSAVCRPLFVARRSLCCLSFVVPPLHCFSFTCSTDFVPLRSVLWQVCCFSSMAHPFFRHIRSPLSLPPDPKLRPSQKLPPARWCPILLPGHR